MIVFKKYHIFALFCLLIASFTGLLQASEESALSRGWQSVSHFGNKVLKHPATPYVAAPAALYAGCKLASSPMEYSRKHTLSPLALYAVGSATAAPTFALTELMRNQRATITRNDRPSKWYFFGPALVQSLIIGGFLLPSAFIPKDLQGTYKGLLATLLLASIVSPGTATGLVSCLKEWSAELDKRMRATENRFQKIENRIGIIPVQRQANQDQRPTIEGLRQRVSNQRQKEESQLQNQHRQLQENLQKLAVCPYA